MHFQIAREGLSGVPLVQPVEFKQCALLYHEISINLKDNGTAMAVATGADFKPLASNHLILSY